MGLFFSNLHIRASESVSADKVQETLTELLKKQGYQPAASADKADITLYLCDKCRQWISVCSDAMDFDSEQPMENICLPLSDRLSTDILLISDYDSDCLILNLLNPGTKTNAIAKVGYYPDLKIRSTPARWKKYIEDIDRWKAALRKEYTFAEDALETLSPMLGLSFEQAEFCDGIFPEEEYPGQIRTLFFTLPETMDKPELPRLKIKSYDRQPCTIGQFKVISALNVGGKSTGLAIVFTGSYIEHEEIRFRDVKLEYRFGKEPCTALPLELEKRQDVNGNWIYYTELPEFQIPPAVNQNLPSRKVWDLEFERQLNVRFTPEGNPRKRLDITVHFIPLKNPIDGQCGWRVWAGYKSKRAFIEATNQQHASLSKKFQESEAFKQMNPDDFDLD
ncbi:MAG: hypothetical protein IJK71_03370 [Clostridia bacterium]|nr:hypothetical protein [Clostridia bacterium]